MMLAHTNPVMSKTTLEERGGKILVWWLGIFFQDRAKMLAYFQFVSSSFVRGCRCLVPLLLVFASPLPLEISPYCESIPVCNSSAPHSPACHTAQFLTRMAWFHCCMNSVTIPHCTVQLPSKAVTFLFFCIRRQPKQTIKERHKNKTKNGHSNHKGKIHCQLKRQKTK